MFKLITDLTDRDKRWFMEMYKRDVLHTYDTTWDEWEKELQSEIKEIYDEEMFAELSRRVAEASAANPSELEKSGSEIYFAARKLERIKSARAFFLKNFNRTGTSTASTVSAASDTSADSSSISSIGQTSQTVGNASATATDGSTDNNTDNTASDNRHALPSLSSLPSLPSILEYLLWKNKNSDGTVFVPASKPKPLKSPPLKRSVKAKKWREMAETAESPIAQSSSEVTVEKTQKPKTVAKTAVKTARKRKTQKSQKSQKASTRRRNNNSGGMNTIDKIRMMAAWAEWAEGAMMPDRLHQLNQLSQLSQLPYKLNESKSNEERKLNQRKLLRKTLHSKLKRATAAIRENPAEFLKNKDFLDLIAFLKNTQHGGGGKFRLAGSFPSVLLRNKGLLRLLPLPVKIEKRPALVAEMAAIIAAKLNSRPMATKAANSANAANKSDKSDTADTAGKSDTAGKAGKADKANTADTANAANSADTANKSDKSVKAPNFNDIVLKELDDEVVIFDWFSTDDPGSEPGSPGSDEETMRLISDFLGTMLRAMGVLPPKK